MSSNRGSSQTAAKIPDICRAEGRNTQIQEIGIIAHVFRSLSSQVDSALKIVQRGVPELEKVASP